MIVVICDDGNGLGFLRRRLRWRSPGREARILRRRFRFTMRPNLLDEERIEYWSLLERTNFLYAVRIWRPR